MNRGINLWQGDLPLCPEISFLFERHQGGLLLKQKRPNWQSGLHPLEEYRCLQQDGDDFCHFLDLNWILIAIEQGACR